MFFKPLWKYSPKDIRTWKYLTYELEKVDNDKFIKWTRNDDFQYEQISNYGDEVRWNIVK